MNAQQVLELGIESLMPDPTQPRQTFLTDDISRLADSIKARGVLSPLRVAFDEERQSWRIVLGESRWRAAKLAGLSHVPCLPMAGQPSEVEILMDQVVENVCRNQLLPMDMARAIDKLRAWKRCTAKELAAEIGISGSTISRSEALLSLPEDLQALIDAGTISANAGYELSRLPDAASQRRMAHEIVEGRISRDGTTAAVQKVVGKKKVTPKAARLPLRLPGGINVTVSAGMPLTWDNLLIALEQVRKQAESLKKNGRDITELAKSLAT
jgi:ParB family transcriptional regulator, chromosome partitioning protein